MGLRIMLLFGWGIVIYAVMFLFASFFATYNVIEGLWARFISLAVLVTLCLVAGRSLSAHSWRDILPYSISWAAVVAIIDGIMLVPFAGWQVYANWSVWLGYCIVALAPLLAHYPRFSRFSASAPV